MYHASEVTAGCSAALWPRPTSRLQVDVDICTERRVTHALLVSLVLARAMSRSKQYMYMNDPISSKLMSSFRSIPREKEAPQRRFITDAQFSTRPRYGQPL